MWEAIVVIAGGVVSIILILLQRKDVAKISERLAAAQEIMQKATRTEIRMRNNMEGGKHYELKKDLDAMHSDIRALRSVLNKKDLPGKT